MQYTWWTKIKERHLWGKLCPASQDLQLNILLLLGKDMLVYVFDENREELSLPDTLVSAQRTLTQLGRIG